MWSGSFPVSIWLANHHVTNGAKVIHIRRLKSDPGVNLLS
ncbi:TPA_asm: integrase [Salmonella enterica subsp. enterica serovar Typhimurium]|nr:integrase [Salmonella enterica subsp. enterica serovar Typhimurium]